MATSTRFPFLFVAPTISWTWTKSPVFQTNTGLTALVFLEVMQDVFGLADYQAIINECVDSILGIPQKSTALDIAACDCQDPHRAPRRHPKSPLDFNLSIPRTHFTLWVRGVW